MPLFRIQFLFHCLPVPSEFVGAKQLILGLWRTSYTLHILDELGFLRLKLKDRYAVDRNGLDGVRAT